MNWKSVVHVLDEAFRWALLIGGAAGLWMAIAKRTVVC